MTKAMIFISYSQQDEQLKDKLLSQLGVLKQTGLLEVWSDERISPGADWKTALARAIAQARVAVLLITANYLNTPFIVAEEIPALLQRRQQSGLIIVPLIAQACVWQKIGWLAEMRVRPKHKQPVWREQGRYVDDDLTAIVAEVAELVNALDTQAIATIMEQYALKKTSPPAQAAAQSLSAMVLEQIQAIDPRTAQKYPFNPTGYRDPLLDALSEQLESQAALSDQLKALLEQYQQTLAASENKGVSIQGDKATVIQQGEQGQVIIGTSIGGDVYGPGTTKNETHYHSSDPGLDAQTLQTAYLNHLLKSSSQLSLAGVDPKAASNEAEGQLNLSAVYTALLTLSPEHYDRLQQGGHQPQEIRHLSALEQLNRQQRLVLLGAPGSGKSTFVNFVAMCLAGEALGHPEANLELLTAPLPDDKGQDQDKRQAWDHQTLLPVKIILRDFAVRGLPAPGQKATVKHLWAFIETELEEAGLQDYAPHLRQTLMQSGGLLLLDGLDEVPTAQQRRVQIKNVVESFAASHPHCRIVVTSRTYAYQKQDWSMPDFSQAVLAYFSAGQIRRFVDGWYAHLAPLRGLHSTEAQGRAEILKRAIFSGQRLRVLAERPLLLTLMSSLHAWRGGSLPEKREELYADTVDLLLDWWESPKMVRNEEGQVVMLQSSLAEWLKIDRDKVRSLLNKVAYQAHVSQPDLKGTADIAEGDLVSYLMRLSQNPEVNPARLVEYLSQRAGLLLPRGVGIYTFPHRTFQEYLAACHLTDHGYPGQVAELVRQDPNRWREATLLAGAKAARGSLFSGWALVEALCRCEAEAQQTTSADAWGALLAGQFLSETLDLTSINEWDQPKLERVKAWLVAILEQSQLPAVERATAGVSLAHLGDPRPGVGLGADGLPDIAWQEIPAGPFVMGDKGQTVKLETYFISQYPITNSQYQAFVEGGGYQEAAYWSEAIEAGYWQEGGFKGEWDNEVRTQAVDYGPPFNLANHPVVGISWYEAMCFCRWLSEQVKQQLTLPSEAQWEKAARGNEGQSYPWGDEADANKANYDETGIGSSSAVGCFPHGKSVYNCLDMSGNVWEWCLDWYDQDKDGRVLRGGSFFGDEVNVRCSFRDYGPPVNSYFNLGFRVVLVSPSLKAVEILASEKRYNGLFAL